MKSALLSPRPAHSSWVHCLHPVQHVHPSPATDSPKTSLQMRHGATDSSSQPPWCACFLAFLGFRSDVVFILESHLGDVALVKLTSRALFTGELVSTVRRAGQTTSSWLAESPTSSGRTHRLPRPLTSCCFSSDVLSIQDLAMRKERNSGEEIRYGNWVRTSTLWWGGGNVEDAYWILTLGTVGTWLAAWEMRQGCTWEIGTDLYLHNSSGR